MGFDIGVCMHEIFFLITLFYPFVREVLSNMPPLDTKYPHRIYMAVLFLGNITLPLARC